MTSEARPIGSTGGQHVAATAAPADPGSVPAPRRQQATLADGRTIIYFDDTAHDDRTLVDTRDLPAVTVQSEIRYDALQGEWVAIAGHRQDRTFRPPADRCPLCPSTPGNPTEIPSPSYDVVVFQNRFPSFALSAGDQPAPDPLPTWNTAGQRPDGAPSPASWPGRGCCEVVCFTADHDATFSQLSPQRVRTVVTALADRTRELSAIPGIRYIYPFENRGTEIGVTLDHPHGQIYGYPYLPPKAARTEQMIFDYRAATGRDLFADLVADELRSTRVIAQNDEWVAFVPFAARWPVEVRLFPLRRVPDLPALDDAQVAALAPLHLQVLHRMEGLVDDTMPAITGWQQAPVGAEPDDYWLNLQIVTIRRDVGKLKYLAGSESGMGAWINDATPELVAQRLRAVEVNG